MTTIRRYLALTTAAVMVLTLAASPVLAKKGGNPGNAQGQSVEAPGRDASEKEKGSGAPAEESEESEPQAQQENMIQEQTEERTENQEEVQAEEGTESEDDSEATGSGNGRGKAPADNGKAGKGQEKDQAQGPAAAQEKAEQNKTRQELRAEYREQLKEQSRALAREMRQAGYQGAYLVFVNGEPVNFTPLLHNGRTMVPFRNLAENLGAAVEWEAASSTVTMVLGETTVELTIGADVALVNGEPVELDAPADLLEDRTYIPLRFVAEALGALVDYDPETGAIIVVNAEPEEPADEEGTEGEEPADEEGTEGEEPADEEPTEGEEPTDEEATEGEDPADEEGAEDSNTP